jgi:hypothetical protein
LLEGIPRAAHFFVQQIGYIIIDRQSGTHIMMLVYVAS